MSDDFFEKILPEGLLCLATPETRKVDGNKFYKHAPCKSIYDLKAQITKFGIAYGNTKELFFCVGSLKEERVPKKTGKGFHYRTKANIKEFKCFFADLDIKHEGEESDKYESQGAATVGLLSFCKTYNFPRPIFVSSGRGLHVYWPLEECISAEDWTPVAEKFRDILIKAKVKIDVSKICDVTTVLRVPNTINLKNNTLVEELNTSTINPISNQVILERISSLALQFKLGSMALPDSSLEIPGVRVIRAVATPDVAPEYESSSFDRIMRHCGALQEAEKTGCEGDGDARWIAALGVCYFTDTPEEAAIRISKNYEKFSEPETLKKLSERSGMHGGTLCSKLEQFYTDACKSCEQYGRINTPLVLGYKDKVLPAPILPDRTDVDPDDPLAPICSPAKPFQRKEGGGVMVKAKLPGDEKERDLVIYDRDFYPIRRSHDEKSDTGSSTWVVDFPHEGKKEIIIDNSIVPTEHKLQEFLASKHIMVAKRYRSHIADYITMYVQKLQSLQAAQIQLGKQGWRDDYKSFAYHTHLFNRDGTRVIHAMSKTTESDIKGLGVKGTLRNWIDGMQFYNVPDHAPHRLCLYAGLGSILYHMTGHKGVMIYLSGESGCGKTTVQKAVNSMWGHPEEMLINGTSSGLTQVAFYGIMNAYNNLPVCMDDVGNLDAKVFCDMALAISQGQGKRRGTKTGSLSQLRENWANITISSSNADAYLSMAREKSNFSAEAMRIFQIHMTLSKQHSKAEADNFLNQSLKNNYGKAGIKFIESVVPDYDNIMAKMLRLVDTLGSKFNITSPERFWVSVIACAALAGKRARAIGLLPDFPVEADIQWGMDYISNLRTQIADTSTSPRELVVQYLNTHIDEMLVLEKSREEPNHVLMPSIKPRDTLNIRFERDNRIIYISKTPFKIYCQEKGQNFSNIEKLLIREDVIVNDDFSGFKVLGAGTEYATGQTRCLKIRSDKLGFSPD